MLFLVVEERKVTSWEATERHVFLNSVTPETSTIFGAQEAHQMGGTSARPL